MPNIANTLRIDIRDAVTQCLSWMEAVKLALETIKARAENRSAQIDLGALGKFIVEADGALHELDDLIAGLLDQDVSLDNGKAAEIDAEHEATLRVLERYADPGFYRETKRKPVSEVMADGGAMARARLDEIEALFGGDGE